MTRGRRLLDDDALIHHAEVLLGFGGAKEAEAVLEHARELERRLDLAVRELGRCTGIVTAAAMVLRSRLPSTDREGQDAIGLLERAAAHGRARSLEVRRG